MISKILPDDQMPVMVDGNTGEKRVIEVVMNPYSTINRRNFAVVKFIRLLEGGRDPQISRILRYPQRLYDKVK